MNKKQLFKTIILSLFALGLILGSKVTANTSTDLLTIQCITNFAS